MPVPWIDSVRSTRQLTVFPTDRVTKGPWAPVFRNALQEFNKLSTTMSFGVTLVQSATPPDEDGLGGANVNFDAASGRVQFRAWSRPFTLNVLGDSMHGHTQRIGFGDGQGNMTQMIKAFVFVPASPTILAGPAGQAKVRAVGDPIKLVIAVHELVHACGLDNQDHSPGNNADIFIGQPQPDDGKTPDKDRMRLRLDPPDNNLFAPPLVLTARTAGLIQRNWR